jgi:hypothetical protein
MSEIQQAMLTYWRAFRDYEEASRAADAVELGREPNGHERAALELAEGAYLAAEGLVMRLRPATLAKLEGKLSVAMNEGGGMADWLKHLRDDVTALKG